jgi:adenylate kinase family enzyme
MYARVFRREETMNPGELSAARRIHIIGGAGAGKTTLARQVAARLSVSTYDLDAIAYEGGAGPARSTAARRQAVHRIATEASWVTEGGYLSWVDALLENADVIVWLDLPFRIAAWRIVLRHVRASLARTNRHRGLRKLARFLLWNWGYYHRGPSHPVTSDDHMMASRAATAHYLAPYRAKLIRCQRPAEVRVVLRGIPRLSVERRADQ